MSNKVDLGDLGPVAKQMPDGRVATLCQGCGEPIAVPRVNFDRTMALRVDGNDAVFACKECSARIQASARSVARLEIF